MPELVFAPDFWRKHVTEARRLADLIDDSFTREVLLDIALQYEELVEHAWRRQRQVSSSAEKQQRER